MASTSSPALGAANTYEEICALLRLTRRNHTATASGRVGSRFEELVDPLLAVVATYLPNADALVRLFNVSRTLRLWVSTSRLPCSLELETAEEADRAAAVLAPAAWTKLRACHVGTDAWTTPLRLCMARLGSSLRQLYLSYVDVDSAAVPPLAWAALKTCTIVVRRLRRCDNAAVVSRNLSVALPALSVERLGLCALGWAFNAHAAQFLRASAGGALRVLSITLDSSTADTEAALTLVAPHLEALRIHDRSWRHSPIRLPPLPRVHTLALSCNSRREFFVAATPHPALRTLQLCGGAELYVADGDGWAVDALHTLAFEAPQSYAGLLSRLEPACGALHVLAVTTATYPGARIDPITRRRPVFEHADNQVGPILCAVGSSLEELSIMSQSYHTNVVGQDLRLELSKYTNLHTLRLSTNLLPINGPWNEVATDASFPSGTSPGPAASTSPVVYQPSPPLVQKRLLLYAPNLPLYTTFMPPIFRGLATPPVVP